MKKLKLFFAAFALLLGVSNASADVTLETDLTSQFSSLTNWQNWNGATGYTSTDFCPKVVVSGGIGEKQVCEKYEATCVPTGEIFYATVNGLAAGTYTIELYGGAAFCFGRGFGSMAFTGEIGTGDAWGTHTSDTYSAGDHIDTGTGVELYATSEDVDYGGEIPIYYATNFPSGAATVTIENIVVGASGSVRIGMKKTSQSTNWHVIQLKSVIATVSGTAAIDALKATATALLSNPTYANVTGSERTNLKAAYDATPAAETKEAYLKVIDDLNTAISAFETCNYAAYDAFVAEKAKATALGLDVSGYTATNAADAETKTQTIMVDEYNYVKTNYPYAVDLGAWTTVNATERSGQHWDGTGSSTYSEQNEGYGSDSWSCSYSQDLTLPAGSYVFKVAGRKSSESAVLTLTVKNGETTLGTVNDFPNGDLGKGIDTSGDTNFGEGTFANNGTGRGWQWRYVKFTLGEEATVNISVTANATAKSQWVGFCNPTVQADNENVVDILAYNIAKASAIAVRDNAQYASVTGSERVALVNAINADPTSDYPAATIALNEASAAVVAAAAAYDNYAAAITESEKCKLVAWPNASTAKRTAFEDACEAGDPTDATDAQTKADAIFTTCRQFVESNGLAEGVSGAINFAAYIKDMDPDVNKGWTNGISIKNTDGEKYTDGSGNKCGKYYDGGWSESAVANINMSRTLTLPAGQYQLQVTARGSAALTEYKMTVGDQSVNLPREGAGANVGTFGHGWSDCYVTFTSDGTPLTLTIAAQSTEYKQWISFNRFRLINLSGDAEVSKNITSAGYATYCSPYPLDFTGTGLTAYIITGAESGNTLALSEVTTVPENTGVLLKGAAGDYNIPVVASAAAVAGNKLVGVTSNTEIEANAGYVLMNEAAGVGFYKNNKAFTVGANTAYLPANFADSEAREAYFFDGLTGINQVENGEVKSALPVKRIVKGYLVIEKNGVSVNAAGVQLK